MVDSKPGNESPRPSSRPWLIGATIAFAFGIVGVVALANSGSATPALLDIVQNIPGRDKTVHFFLMGTMALLLNLCWSAEIWKLGPIPVLKGSVVVAVLVTIEEISQTFVPVRSFSLEDLAYDYLGILFVGHCHLIYAAGKKHFRRKAASTTETGDANAGPR